MSGYRVHAWPRASRTGVASLVLVVLSFCGPAVNADPFKRGDTDQNGQIDATDSIRILQFLFSGGPGGTCLDALDVDDSGEHDITDGIYGLIFLFLGGPPPPPPFIECDVDPTDDAIDCVSHAFCPAGDGSAPEIEISSPENLLVVGTTEVEVRGLVSDVNDALGDLDVSVNSVAADLDLDTGEFVVTIPLGEGNNDVTAVAVDPAGNAGSITITLVRDTAPPVIAVDNPQDDFVTNEARVTITGYLNDSGSSQVGGEVGSVFVRSTTEGGQPIVNGVVASLQGRAFVVLDLPLRRGVNIIEVTGVDGVGNEAQAVVRRVTFTDISGQRIVRVSGDGQVDSILQLLPAPLVTSLVDRDGRAVPNRVVKFEVVRNSGLLSTTAGPGPRSRAVFVRTDENGRAAAFMTLGDRIGAGFNRVRAAAVGFQGEVLFCATALAGIPTQVLATQGTNQTGIPGQPLPTPLVVQAVDEEGNPIPQLPITFRVAAGGGTLSRGGKKTDGSTELIVETNDEGLASAVFNLGLQEGINAHVALAAFEDLQGLESSFIASALVPGAVRDTAVVGTVLDNSDLPLEGVTVRILDSDLSTTTDDQGQFRLDGAPVGTVHLLIDGTTTTREGLWPSLEFEITTIAGQDNSVGEPIRLPEVDESSGKMVGGNETVVVEMQGVPGMSITVFPNSTTFPDGSRTGVLTLSQVKLDKVPMPPPNGSIFMPPAWTIQPAGVLFDPPARVSIPNDGLPEGRIIDIFQFDHVLEQFVNIGTGTVVSDASVIISDPGFGIVRAGWGGCGQPPPPQTCAGGCDDGNPCTTDSCVNGACQHAPVANNTACDDGDPCTKDDKCTGGACQPGDPVYDVNGSDADKAAWQTMLSNCAKKSEKMRSICGESDIGDVDVNLGRDNTVIDSFATNAVDLDDLEALDAKRCAWGSDSCQFIIHFMEERVDRLRTGNPDFGPAHAHGIDCENEYRTARNRPGEKTVAAFCGDGDACQYYDDNFDGTIDRTETWEMTDGQIDNIKCEP